MEPFAGLHSKPEPLRPWGASAAGCWEGRHSSQPPARMLRGAQVDGHAADEPVLAGGRGGAAPGRAGGAFSGRGHLSGRTRRSKAAAPPDGNDDASGGPSKCQCHGLWQQLRETEAEAGPLGVEGE